MSHGFSSSLWSPNLKKSGMLIVSYLWQPIARFQGQASDIELARREVRNVKNEMVIFKKINFIAGKIDIYEIYTIFYNQQLSTKNSY